MKRSKNKKYVGLIKDDILIVLLDMIAIHAAYFQALILCIFADGYFSETLSKLMYQYSRFALYYTVICVIVFYIFKLYGGMWRYVGRNDIKRMICATGVTTVCLITGTLPLLRKMPIVFYSIGMILQFTFVVFIRFALRMILTEKKQSVYTQIKKKSIAFRDSTRLCTYKEEML